MTILLPLEIKVREFHSKIFLASKLLDETNFDVVIGEKNKVHNLFKHNQGVYLLSKGGPRKRFRFDKKKYRNNFLGILDEEGPISNFDKNEKKSRLNNHILENIDDYFLWGSGDLRKNRLIFKNFKKKLNMFGHPKFDILKKNHIKFYQKEITSIKKKYKKFIFVSSSFPVDQIMKQSTFNKFRFDNFFFVMGKNKEAVKKNFNRYLDLERENYLSLIELLNKFASQNPQINIVFRPHPRQRLDLVKKRFDKNNKNIKIIYEDGITPWIAASELYLHGGCTSFLEAASLEKKMIYFVKSEHEKKAQMFREYGYYFKNLDKCLKFMNSNIKKNKFNLKRSKKPKLIISNSDTKKIFYKKFIAFLKRKYSYKLFPIKTLYVEKNSFEVFLSNIKIILKKIILKTPLLVDIFFQLDGSNILSREYKLKKFPYLLKKEISDCLLSKSKQKNKITIKQLSKDLFHLSRLN